MKIKSKWGKIALLLVLVAFFVLSASLLVSSVSYLINMLRSTMPIDSFGTVELGIALVAIFSFLTLSSAVLIGILAAKYLKKPKKE